MRDDMPPDSGIVFAPARDLARWIAERRLGAEELMNRFLARIEAVNPTVNAIVTLLPEAALDGARGRRTPPWPEASRRGRSMGCPSRSRISP